MERETCVLKCPVSGHRGPCSAFNAPDSISVLPEGKTPLRGLYGVSDGFGSTSAEAGRKAVGQE